jgi:hypothetical protein
MGMTNWICATCGVRAEASVTAPANCPICEDPRQYVGLDGQKWTTMEELAASGRRNVFTELEPGVWSIQTTPHFAIGQRAFLLETAEGNLLWDCVTLLDEETRAFVAARGGVRAIALSHPHYYSAMAAWGEAFGAPVYVHAFDEAWVQERPGRLELWEGETLPLFGGVQLVRSGGHFDGYAVAHWDRGLLFAGDQPQVCMDQRWVSFMWSYPNLVPFSAAELEGILRSLEPLAYDRLYGAFGRQVIGDAKGAVARSAERYRRAIAG